MIHFVLYTKPVPVNSLYRCVNKRQILSRRGRIAKNDLSTELMCIDALRGNFKPLKRCVAVNLILYFGDKRKRDIDAHIKVLLDSMNGVVYVDDSQITELHVYKEYDKENPRTEVQIV